MAIEFLGVAAGAGEISTEVWAFAKTEEFSDLVKVWKAFDAAHIWAVLWAVTENKIYIEFDDFMTYDRVEAALKEYGI